MTSTQSPPTRTACARPRTSSRPGRAPPSDARGRRGASRLFRWTATGAGALILVVLVAVAAFLVLRAWPALTTPAAELTEKVTWMGEATSLLDFVGPLIFGTILAAALALVIATPIALGIALFTSHYAPRRLASGLGYLVDLLAAIPSVVYGLWGGLVLAPMVSRSGRGSTSTSASSRSSRAPSRRPLACS